MELQVRTLQGTAKLQVLADTSVLDLKRQLHQEYSSTLDVPEPGRQRLVYKDDVLADADSLQDKGMAEGDAVVMLPVPVLARPPQDATLVPSSASIREAIYAEARARGTEHTLKEEAPRQTAPGETDISRRIMELLEQALGGLQLPGMPAGGVEGMAPLAEAAAALAQVSLQVGSGVVPPVVIQDGGAQQPQPPAAPSAPEPPLQVPEPRADQVATLTDMGFSEAVARKALLLTRCNVQLALEWVLQHMDDPDADTPPTQEQLRQVYGPRRSAVATPEALTQTLMDMGFSQAAASGALRRFGNMEAALAFLLTGAGAQAAAGAPGAATAGPGGATTEGAGGAPAGAQTGLGSSQNPSAAAAAGAGPSSHAVQALNDEAGSQDEEGEASPEEEEDEEEEYDYDGEGQEEGEEDETYEEEEDEFEDLDDELARQLPLHLEDALDGMGSMDLATLGSANMEQLLQGASMEELYGHQLLMNPEAVDITSNQEALQRLADIAAMLQQAMGAGAAAAGAAGGGAAAGGAPQGGAGGEAADGPSGTAAGAAGSRGASRGGGQGA